RENHCRGSDEEFREWRLEAAGSSELPLLEALFAEDRPALRRPERYGRFLPARRALCLSFDPLPHGRRTRTDPICPFGLARLAAFGLVLELLVGKEQLFTGRPDELRPAVHAP